MKNNRKNVEERQLQILRLIRQKGEVRSEDISKKFNISIMTVRRDLEYLEQNQLIKRTHGGALSIDKIRATRAIREDIAISRDMISEFASQFIDDGDSIFINGSTTALNMLNYIKNKSLTVYTNNGRAINGKYSDSITIKMTGGELRNNIMVGDFTMRNLLEATADKTFLGCAAVYDDGEFQYNIPNEIGINEAMIARTKNQLYILADHTKLMRQENRENSYGSCSYERPVTLITDDKADPDIVKKLRTLGMEILIVS